MYAALSLIALCFYKVAAIVFYTLGFGFQISNWAIKIADWSLYFIKGLWKVLIYIFDMSIACEKKLVYAYGFCTTERKKLVHKLRSNERHT